MFFLTKSNVKITFSFFISFFLSLVIPFSLVAQITDADWGGMPTNGPFNGKVWAVATDSSGNIYAGGEFTAVGGIPANHIAKWNGANWAPLGSGLTTGTSTTTVYSIAFDGSGNLYAGGDFTLAGGVTVKNIAKWNGTSWSTVGSGLFSPVRAIVFDNFGNFYVASDCVYQWNGTYWVRISGGALGGPFLVYSLVCDNSGNLYAGGMFPPANRVAKWDGTSWTALGSGPDNAVYSLAIDGTGNLYAGGSFTTAGGNAANYIAKWDGASWSALGSGVSAAVNSIKVDATGKVIVASAWVVGSWDGSSWTNQSMGFPINAMAIDNSSGKFLVGGGDTTSGNLVAYDGVDIYNLKNTLNDKVEVLAFDSNSGHLYAGGDFTVAGGFKKNGGDYALSGGLSANKIVKWNGMQWENLGTGVNGKVRVISLNPTGIYVAGDFTTAGGQPANHIAKWDGVSWSPLGSGLDGTVHAIAVRSPEEIYAGGEVAGIGYVARWDGSNWWNCSPPTSVVRDIALDFTYIYIARDFYKDKILRWDGYSWGGDSWSPLGFPVSYGPEDPVYVLKFDTNGNLFAVSSNFSQNCASVFKWNGTNWSTLNFNTQGGIPNSFACYAGNIYLGGDFTGFNPSFSAKYIAGFDGANLFSLGSGVNGNVRSIIADGSGNIYVGGEFTASGSVSPGEVNIGEYLAKCKLPNTINNTSTYTLCYDPFTYGGSITGSCFQTVDSGASGSAVRAVPYTGYHFVGWSDLSTTNPRTDCNVTGDIGVTAYFASSFSIEDDFLFDADTHKITSYLGAGGNVAIPSSIASVAVTSIGDYAFYGCDSLVGVTIPSGMMTIGDDVFRGCSSLSTITIPSGVTALGRETFSYCNSLSSIALPDTVTSIGAYSFYNCASLTSVTLSSNLSSIADGTFYGCVGLTAITIPSTVTAIGTEAFDNCSTLTDISVDASNANYSSADGVLFNNDKTSLIRCPAGKSGSYSIPSGVTTIEANAFAGCANLTSVTIPSTVTSIKSNAFYGCEKLATAYFDGNAPEMESYVFDAADPAFAILYKSASTGFTSPTWKYYPTYCYDRNYTLTYTAGTHGSVTGTSPQSVAYGADGTQITAVADANYQFYNWSDASTANPRTDTKVNGNITVTANFTSPASDFTFNPSTHTITGYSGSGGLLVIPPKIGNVSVYSIGPLVPLYSTFGNSVTSVIIPYGVTTIGEGAFNGGCFSLTDVTIPNSVTSIGDAAFGGCISLVNINIPSSVTTIAPGAFNYCANLVNIAIPSSVKTIGFNAFWKCYSLANITIPYSVTSIGSNAFSECNSMTNIVVHSANQNYSSFDGVLYNKTKTTLIQCPEGKVGTCTIPASVTSILDSAFTRCSLLTAISVDAANANYSSVDGVLFSKDEITLIKYPGGKNGDYAVPLGVTSIANAAFSNCASLTNVTIPSSVTSVGNSVFCSCSNLTSAYFEGNAPSTFGSIVFLDAAASFKIYYKSSATGFTTPTWNGYPCYPRYTVTFVEGENGAITGTKVQAINHGLDCSDVTAVPAANHHFVNWTGDFTGTDTTIKITNVTSDMTITANFAIDTFAITSSAGAHGSITASAAVDYGTDKTFTITPDIGYHVADVLVDGGSVGAVGSYTFTNVTAVHTISVSFVIDTFTITATAGANGSISPSGILSIDYGDEQSFTITADGGHSITDVIVDGSSVGAVGSYTFTNVTADHSISASFSGDVVTPLNGLVAWWRAEDNGLDSIGNNNGTLQGGVTYAAGRVGQAFSFDGADDFVTIANESNFDFERTSPFSIEAWIKTSVPVSGDIFSKYLSALPYTGYQLVVTNGGQVHFYLINTWDVNVIGVRTSSSVNDGSFHHIAVTYDGSSQAAGVKIYLDGISQALTTVYDSLTGSILNDVNPTISKDIEGNYFNGLVDEVKVFNRALSASEIASQSGMVPDGFSFTAQTGMPKNATIISNPITVTGITYPTAIGVTGDAGSKYQINGGAWTNSNGTLNPGDSVAVQVTSSSSFSTKTTATLTIGGVSANFDVTTAAANDPSANGLVAWWKAEGNALDSVGTCDGSWSGTEAYAAGEVGQAFSFNGTDSYVDIANNSSMDFGTGNFSISFWLKLNSLASDQTLIHKSVGSVLDNTNKTYFIEFNAPNSLRFRISDTSSANDLVVPTSLNIGQWYQLTAVRVGNTSILYLDGSQIGSQTAGSNIDIGTGGVERIGNIAPNGAGADRPVSGYIDEVKIYSRALLPSEAVFLAGSNYVWNATAEGDFDFNPATGTITKYKGSSFANVVIPFTIGGVPVTAIGNNAFSGKSCPSIAIPCSVTSIGNFTFAYCTGLTSISIPSTVTSIGIGAFESCTVLPAIEIPSGVTFIGEEAFFDCKALQSFSIPSGITSIGSKQFYGCKALTSITIPDSVTSIGDDAFSNCKALAALAIPSSVTSIGARAFAGNEKLDGVTIPSGVTAIKAGTFTSCSSLSSIIIPDDVTSIGSRAFYGTSFSAITIPGNVTSIGGAAFGGCNLLTQIAVDSGNQNYASVNGVLFNKDKTSLIQYPTGRGGAYKTPSGVTSIEEYAFAGAVSLSSVSISEGISSIREGAFNGCPKLSKATIPSSATSVGDYAFAGCASLSSAYFYGDAPAAFGTSVFASAAPPFTIFYNSSGTGFTTPLWKNYPCYQIVTFENGMVRSGIAGPSKLIRMYTINVPLEQNILEIRTTGTRGDCDLDVVDPAGATAKHTMNANCNELVQIANPADGDWLIYLSGITDYSGVTLSVKYAKQTVAPAVPSGVNASDGLFDDRIVVSWKPVPGATGYIVGRKNKLTDANFAEETETADTVFEDVSQAVTGSPGTIFYYFVKAKNMAGDGKYSSGNSGFVAKAPSTIGVPSASDGTYFDKIRVSWAKAKGATSYLIYRTETTAAPDLDTDLIGETTALFYDDFGDKILPPVDAGVIVMKKYYYWIRAKNQGGTTDIAISKCNEGYISRKGPATISASKGTYSAKVAISWTAVPGSTSYDVYRDGVLIPDGNTACTTFPDTPGDGDVHSYQVKAKYKDKYDSVFSLAAKGNTGGAWSPGVERALDNDTGSGNITNKDKGSSLYYSVDVPFGTTRLVATLDGSPVGTNDCDLFAKFANYPTKSSYGAKGVEAGTTETITISNPAPGTWYFLLYGTTAYTNVSLTVKCYSAADIVLTQVPSNDLAIPFTASFKGRLLDENGAGIPNMVLQIRNPVTGLTSFLNKTDAKGYFSYSALINSEGEHTFDFFFDRLPDTARGTACHTVATKKSCPSDSSFDYSTYLPAAPVEISSQTDIAGLQHFLDTRNGWDEDAIVNGYRDMWIKSTITKAGNDSTLFGKLDSGLYMFFYGVEGAGMGNVITDASTIMSALSAVPFVVHVAEGQKSAVLNHLLAQGIINATQKTLIGNGQIGMIAIAAFDLPDDVEVPDNISLLAKEQLELLAKFAGGSQDVLPTDGGTYSDVPTMKSTFTLNGGSRKINVLSAVFVK